MKYIRPITSAVLATLYLLAIEQLQFHSFAAIIVDIVLVVALYPFVYFGVKAIEYVVKKSWNMLPERTPKRVKCR